MDSGLLDVSNGVLYHAGEGVHGDGPAGFSSGNGCFCSLHHACSLQRGNLHHLAAQGPGELLGVDLIPVFSDHVHHVDGYHHRNPQLRELRG